MWSSWTTLLRHKLTTSSKKHKGTPTRSTSWFMTTPTGMFAGLTKKQKINQIPTNVCLRLSSSLRWIQQMCGSVSSRSSSCCSADSGVGLVDKLLNSRQVTEATNILILHVTSFPFALQTQRTRISPYNEINWPSAFSNVSLCLICGTRFDCLFDVWCLHVQDVDLYHERTRYFGVSEILETTHSGSSLPLMRYDSSFESMASTLEERCCTQSWVEPRTKF